MEGRGDREGQPRGGEGQQTSQTGPGRPGMREALGSQAGWQAALETVSPTGTWLSAISWSPKMDLGHQEGRRGRGQADEECESEARIGASLRSRWPCHAWASLGEHQGLALGLLKGVYPEAGPRPGQGTF